MGLSGVPASERIHIGFFGMRNAGKSSLINAITGQNVSIVSDTPGTTTDPVTKTMELLPIGPVVLIDTPGVDDIGDLGKMRVKKAHEFLTRCDLVVIVIDATVGKSSGDADLITVLKEKKIPYIVCYNKSDLVGHCTCDDNEICVSAKDDYNINELKMRIAGLVGTQKTKYIVADRISAGDIVVLVIPIDESAPKGRLILPQQQVLREVLDYGGICVCVQPDELSKTLDSLNIKPKVVITDSQAFKEVAEIVPEEIMLTSFSVLFMNYKGELNSALENASKISSLKDGDVVLVAEGCTHHRQCNDIGTVKIPAMLKNFTKADLSFEFCSGHDFPDDLSKYSLIIHCGGCMLTENEVKARQSRANTLDIPITNYGITMAYVNGILERATEIFKLR